MACLAPRTPPCGQHSPGLLIRYHPLFEIGENVQMISWPVPPWTSRSVGTDQDGHNLKFDGQGSKLCSSCAVVDFELVLSAI